VTFVVVEARATARSGASVHETAARLSLRRHLLLLLRPGGCDGDAARGGEGKRPRMTCQVDRKDKETHTEFQQLPSFPSRLLFELDDYKALPSHR
jgi:hypothetical protein